MIKKINFYNFIRNLNVRQNALSFMIQPLFAMRKLVWIESGGIVVRIPDMYSIAGN